MSTNDKKYKPATLTETEQPQNTAPAAPKQTANRDANGNLIGERPKTNPLQSNMETRLTTGPEGGYKKVYADGALTQEQIAALGGNGQTHTKETSSTPAAGSTGNSSTPSTGSGANTGTNTNAGTNTGATAAPTFDDPYAAELKAQYDAIVNRQPFSYNAVEDPLYQQYVDKYVQGGKLAMRDSMGQAAALTGGYGSSYGQAVGQQQYNEYMRSLADVMPELYGEAYDRYQDEGDRMLQNYQMLNEQSDDAYAKFRDAYSDYVYNEQMAYDRQQTAYQNLQNIIAATGMIPTEEQLAAAGMSAEEARALRMEYAKADPKTAVRQGLITEEEYKQITGKKYKGSGGNAAYGYSGNYTYNDEIRDIQERMRSAGYDIAVDGYEGPETSGAFEVWSQTDDYIDYINGK